MLLSMKGSDSILEFELLVVYPPPPTTCFCSVRVVAAALCCHPTYPLPFSFADCGNSTSLYTIIELETMKSSGSEFSTSIYPPPVQLRCSKLHNAVTLHKVAHPVVSESRFFNLETRMRVSPIQSRPSRRDREFLTLTLRLRDEIEKKFPPISGIEMRSRFIIFILRLRDENENSLDLILFFETRPRILKVAIFP